MVRGRRVCSGEGSLLRGHCCSMEAVSHAMSWALPFRSGCFNILALLAVLALVSEVWKRIMGPGFKVAGKHVFITGGSSGLGKETALKYAVAGADVTLVSRSGVKLEEARREIQGAVPAGCCRKVHIIPCDVTRYDDVVAALEQSTEFHGRAVDVLVCSAGLSVPGHFVESSVATHEQQMQLNYFGTLYTIKAGLPALLAKKEGHIVMISSAVCFAGMVGYAQYAPSKFALRGLADCLRNELRPHGIRVTIYFPSSMDTPGYAEELKTAPKATKEIEGPTTLFTPAQCATHLVQGISRGEYGITDEVLTHVACQGTNGPVPGSNLFLNILLAAPITLVSHIFHLFADYVARKHVMRAEKMR